MTGKKRIGWLVEYSVVGILGLIVYRWGSELDWRIGEVGMLELFPLLGLIAFATMWWHFFVAFMNRVRPGRIEKNERLHTISIYWVLAAYLLHPTLLLLWGLDRSIGGPVEIYEAYVGPELIGYVYLGTLGLLGFLLYDVAQWFSDRPFFQNRKKTITTISDLAFVAIFIHSLQLGQHTQGGWFGLFWWLLGLSGISFILYRYYYQSRHSDAAQPIT
jgi:hypothetical protein